MDNAASSASKLAHRSGASMTPSSETRTDSISLRIAVLFLDVLISCSRTKLRKGPGPDTDGDRSGPGTVKSPDGDLAHVDGDQQRLREELVVALPGGAPPRGGDDDAIDVAVVGGVEH